MIQEQQLGQTRPSAADTSEALITVGSDETYVVKGLFITNLVSSDITINVYSDSVGSTTDDTTVIIKNMVIPAGQFLDLSTLISLTTSGATISVECNTGDGANFTAFGAVIT